MMQLERLKPRPRYNYGQGIWRSGSKITWSILYVALNVGTATNRLTCTGGSSDLTVPWLPWYGASVRDQLSHPPDRVAI